MIPFGLATAAIVLVPLVATAQQGRDDASFVWSKALASGATLTIRNANGPIDVREASNDRVEVRATKRPRGGGGSLRDVSFDVRETSGGTTICTVYDGASACDDNRRTRNPMRVDYTILIPRATRLRLETGNGDIAIDKAGADVTAATGNGRVSIGETSGRVDASTGNGDVEIESAGGPVRASTGNGRVVVVTAAGPVTASSGNGDVAVRMKTVPADASMTLSTGSGSIRVTLPSDYNGVLDASTGNGTLRTDFEIALMGRIDPRHVHGTIGRGGPLLRLSTGNGNVEVRKG